MTWPPDSNIRPTALAMVKRYGVVAILEAAARANQLAEDGDPAGAASWHRILDAIERLQSQKPSEGEPVH